MDPRSIQQQDAMEYSEYYDRNIRCPRDPSHKRVYDAHKKKWVCLQCPKFGGVDLPMEGESI